MVILLANKTARVPRPVGFLPKAPEAAANSFRGFRLLASASQMNNEGFPANTLFIMTRNSSRDMIGRDALTTSKQCCISIYIFSGLRGKLSCRSIIHNKRMGIGYEFKHCQHCAGIINNFNWLFNCLYVPKVLFQCL